MPALFCMMYNTTSHDSTDSCYGARKGVVDTAYEQLMLAIRKGDICGLQESRSHGNEIKKQRDMLTTTTFRIRNMPARASIKMLVTEGKK
jgi:hypothetical protein